MAAAIAPAARQCSTVEGNLWVGDNFTVGWQGHGYLWQGNATKFDPNGKPLSPLTTGFAGGGMQGGTFGAAVDAKDNAWLGTATAASRSPCSTRTASR